MLGVGRVPHGSDPGRHLLVAGSDSVLEQRQGRVLVRVEVPVEHRTGAAREFRGGGVAEPAVHDAGESGQVPGYRPEGRDELLRAGQDHGGPGAVAGSCPVPGRPPPAPTAGCRPRVWGRPEPAGPPGSWCPRRMPGTHLPPEQDHPVPGEHQDDVPWHVGQRADQVPGRNGRVGHCPVVDLDRQPHCLGDCAVGEIVAGDTQDGSGVDRDWDVRSDLGSCGRRRLRDDLRGDLVRHPADPARATGSLGDGRFLSALLWECSVQWRSATADGVSAAKP
jgi:hypothetical protein